MIGTREQLHKLIDRLPDSELDTAKRYLEALQGASGIPRALTEASEEEEPLSVSEAAAIAEAEVQANRGELISDDEFDQALATEVQRHQFSVM